MWKTEELKVAYKHDQVNHPSHYNNGGIECIDAMVSAFGEESVTEFCKLNAFKYIWRAGSKAGNSETQDLRKAIWYLNKAVELIGDDNRDDGATEKA